MIRSPATVEHRQSRYGIDRKSGDHLGISVALDLPLLDDDVTDERLTCPPFNEATSGARILGGDDALHVVV